MGSRDTNGKVHGRWHGTSPCDTKLTIVLWTHALQAYEGKSSELIPPGPRSRVGTTQLKKVSSSYRPKRDQFAFRRPESAVLCVGVGHQPKAMEYATVARGARAQSAGEVHSASLGNPSGGARAGGRLKPEIIVAIGGDRLPRLGSDVVTFEDIRGFLVAYSEHEQQTDIKNQGGGDRVLAGRRELAESAIQMVVADEFYNGKPCVDLSEEELMQGLKKTLLALIWRKRVMRVFPPDIPCAEYGCERVGR